MGSDRNIGGGMDHLQRVLRLLGWLCVGLYFGGYSIILFAADQPAVERFQYGFLSGWYTSGPGGECAAAIAARNEANPGPYPAVPDSVTYNAVDGTGMCRGTYPGFSTLVYDIADFHRGYYCPTGTLQGDMCIDVLTCETGAGAGYYPSMNGSSACVNGCKVTRGAVGQATTCSGWSDVSGWSSCFMAQNGENCTVGTGDPTGPVNNFPQCPVGQCPGTINGQSVCVNCTGKTNTQSTATKTIIAPDGTQTSTSITTNTTSNTNNTTSTTSTTTTTTTPPGGTPTTTTQTEQEDKPKEAFCIENPDSPLCIVSTFGGGCGSFSCDGDAVQCAMAKEQHKRNCTMFDTDTAESTLGKQAAAGNDPQAPNYPTAPGKVETVNLATAIDTTNPFAAGCVQDKSFQIMTTTLVIPFSNICPYLEVMGQTVFAFSLLMAARIAFSGV